MPLYTPLAPISARSNPPPSIMPSASILPRFMASESSSSLAKFSAMLTIQGISDSTAKSARRPSLGSKASCSAYPPIKADFPRDPAMGATLPATVAAPAPTLEAPLPATAAALTAAGEDRMDLPREARRGALVPRPSRPAVRLLTAAVLMRADELRDMFMATLAAHIVPFAAAAPGIRAGRN